MIELSDVTFAWGPRTLFSDVNLRVDAGSLCGVLGPNGAGKSTLLRIVLGLLAPTRGVVRIDGVDIRTLSRREVAYAIAAMLQDEPTLFPMTVTECVLLGRVARLPPHGFESPGDLVAAERALDEAGVRTLAERRLDTLSGGERRRVLLARALAQDTTTLVLDEPAANLDLRHQLELFSLLRRHAERGAAIVASVHDLDLAARSCSEVLLLDGRGGVVQGAPADVLTTARVADVFGVEVMTGQTADGAPYFVPLRPIS